MSRTLPNHPAFIPDIYGGGVVVAVPEALADADAEDDEEALADVELLADETGLDDGEIFGDDVGFVDLLGFALAEVAGDLDGCSTVLGVGLAVTG